MRIHILHKPGELREWLCNLRREHEGAHASANLNNAPLDKILNCPPHRDSAHVEANKQLIFGGKLIAGLIFSTGNLGSQNFFNLPIKRTLSNRNNITSAKPWVALRPPAIGASEIEVGPQNSLRIARPMNVPRPVFCSAPARTMKWSSM